MPILYCSTRRGRPRNPPRGHDTGTPELVMKRLLNETREALDLCLERGIITPAGHWCGIHLRWLYTLRYGAPGVRAVDPAHLGGRDVKLDDPRWRELREQEYHEAVLHLQKSGYAEEVLGLCVYNERPSFLNPVSSLATAARHARASERFREGLDILRALWEKSPAC